MRDTLDVTGPGHRSGHGSRRPPDPPHPVPAEPRRARPASGSTPTGSSSTRLVVARPGPRRVPGRAPGGRPAGARRARPADRPARAPGRRRDRQRRRRPGRVREAHAPGRDGQREGRAGARADPARQLRRRRRPPAAHARAVPRRPRRAARDGRRAVRRDEARQRDRPDRPDARALLRRRRVQARRPARSDPAALPDAPVPPGDRRPASRSLEERLVAIEAAAAARGAERARSAAKGGDFEDLLEAMLADLARGAGDLLDRTGTEAGLGHEVEEGRLRADPRRAGRARLRRPGRDRGQGPPDVDAGDPRRAARGEGEPRRGRRGRRVHAGPRAVRASRRSASSATTSTASSTRRRPSRPRSRRRSAWPGCSPSPRSSSTRSRWMPRPSPRR